MKKKFSLHLPMPWFVFHEAKWIILPKDELNITVDHLRIPAKNNQEIDSNRAYEEIRSTKNNGASRWLNLRFLY